MKKADKKDFTYVKSLISKYEAPSHDLSRDCSGYNPNSPTGETTAGGETVYFIETAEESQKSTEGAEHYQQNRIESILKYERVYGTLGVMVFCEINADKYRDRIGKKEGQSIRQELHKIATYENAAKFFRKKLGSPDEIKIDNYKTERFAWQAK